MERSRCLPMRRLTVRPAISAGVANGNSMASSQKQEDFSLIQGKRGAFPLGNARLFWMY
jgi:hypothetical protein